jgi:hypothetical protein
MVSSKGTILVSPRHSTPYGLSYEEWSIKWWQWLLSVPKSNNPAFDSTGRDANVGQSDPNVFFLCQTYERVKSIPDRSIHVHASKSVFMPIINWISILHIDGETDQELASIAKQRMDVVANLEIVINGTKINKGLEKYRAQSPFFYVVLPEDNIIEASPGTKRCISDGYWVFLTSLERYTRLSSFGSCSSGVTRIGVHYEISTG